MNSLVKRFLLIVLVVLTTFAVGLLTKFALVRP
jgi:hypothetical protein